MAALLRYLFAAIDAGRLSRAQAEALLDTYRRCFIFQPYRLPAPYALKREYAEARARGDRRIVANLIRELGGGYIEGDVGREP